MDLEVLEEILEVARLRRHRESGWVRTSSWFLRGSVLARLWPLSLSQIEERKYLHWDSGYGSGSRSWWHLEERYAARGVSSRCKLQWIQSERLAVFQSLISAWQFSSLGDVEILYRRIYRKLSSHKDELL